jgi:hypothetical protein
MLRRVNAALYEGDLGEDVELFVVQQGNGGVETAMFEYNGTVLPAHPIQGHPGCEFTVVSGTHQFQCIAVFNPASQPSARYDLFQVNSAGGQTALNKSVTAADPAPLIGFAIDAVAVALAARPASVDRGAAPVRPPAPVRPRPSRTIRTRAPKKATPAKGRKSNRKPVRKKSTKKTKKKPAARTKKKPVAPRARKRR